MNKVYLSLGSNRGARAGSVRKGGKLLAEKTGNIINTSSIYETPPWKMVDDTNFLNQVILLETNFTAVQLMDIIIQVEALIGRIRTQNKYEPRIIDIDILFFNDEVINEEGLIVPHPLIQERRFVLEPMAEIAPTYIHPALRKSIIQLLDECSDKSKLRKWS
jgi:2-amino-4-hydroxy-6-hydroxymethyldihydropteridine diphosphokinase